MKAKIKKLRKGKLKGIAEWRCEWVDKVVQFVWMMWLTDS